MLFLVALHQRRMLPLEIHRPVSSDVAAYQSITRSSLVYRPIPASLIANPMP